MLKKIMAQKLVILAFLAGLALAGGAYFFNLPQQLGLPLPGSAANAQAAPVPTPQPRPGIMYPLKERIVNLADDKGKRYLKISLTLQLKASDKPLTPEQEKEEMARLEPVVEDAVTTILTSKTFDQVITAEGKEALKAEIRDKLNEIMGEGKVERVFITDFVVQ